MLLNPQLKQVRWMGSVSFCLLRRCVRYPYLLTAAVSTTSQSLLPLRSALAATKSMYSMSQPHLCQHPSVIGPPPPIPRSPAWFLPAPSQLQQPQQHRHVVTSALRESSALPQSRSFTASASSQMRTSAALPQQGRTGAAAQQYYVTCHPGLEGVVAAELASQRIAAQNIRTGRAGVYFRCGWNLPLDHGCTGAVLRQHNQRAISIPLIDVRSS